MSELPLAEFAFPGPLRDALVAAILDGTKTTTSSLLQQHLAAGEALPQVGECSAVVDSSGQVVCVIQFRAVEVIPLGSVSLAHAVAEGEGFQTVEQWRAAHQTFWGSEQLRAELGPDFVLNDSTSVVVEEFAVVSRTSDS